MKTSRLNWINPMTTNAPDNCKCDPGTWVNGPTEICGDPEYDGSEVCFNCDHDKACHTTTTKQGEE